ncbi:HPr family phosphocarrier protein [Rubrimonas sp.]|uniref:HPr family phosphocarrier protein n=1 Tax=Rubrimonas sp. TaxID=2036015 RepID=UPI002FDCAC96
MSVDRPALAAPLRRRLRIVNAKGLHARASAKFVETVERFDACATVGKDGMEVDGGSIMGLLMLAACKDSAIAVETRGPQAKALMEALDALVADRFGEES